MVHVDTCVAVFEQMAKTKKHNNDFLIPRNIPVIIDSWFETLARKPSAQTYISHTLISLDTRKV